MAAIYEVENTKTGEVTTYTEMGLYRTVHLTKEDLDIAKGRIERLETMVEDLERELVYLRQDLKRK